MNLYLWCTVAYIVITLLYAMFVSDEDTFVEGLWDGFIMATLTVGFIGSAIALCFGLYSLYKLVERVI